MKRGWLLACLTLIFCVITCGMVYADGSRDFYPSKIKGNRAFLVSHEGLRVRNASLPFLTLGTHYVYVRAGEKLVVASSAQGIGQGKMILTDPNNKIYDSGNSSVGRISDNGNGTRAAELAGPRRGYAAYEVYVNEESAGIWKVEFIPPSGKADPEVGQNKVPNILADANWTQTNEYYIAAWDISVRNKADEDWIQGRVFTNNLNLQISDEQIENPDQAFYGVNYVLTNDGYVYRVQGNGSNGIAFSYFVNSQGFLDENNKPLYRSIDNSRLDGYKIQDPRSVDKGGSITHKILYTLPDENMPDIGYGAVPDGKTWLFKKNEDIEIQDIKIIGVEGTPGYVSLRGSNIRFVTNVAASYKIFISSVHADYAFEPVELFVNAKTGENSIFWNGRDGNDKPLPIGEDFPIKLKIQKLGGEVHFPYIDMEINPKGIIIELLDKDLSSVKSDIVYWDDRDLTPGLPSEQSNPLTNLDLILVL